VAVLAPVFALLLAIAVKIMIAVLKDAGVLTFARARYRSRR